jgi:hypothetical protein
MLDLVYQIKRFRKNPLFHPPPHPHAPTRPAQRNRCGTAPGAEAGDWAPPFQMESTRLTLLWVRQYRQERKRLLDTQLAATHCAADVTRLLTLNRSHFEIFDVFRPSRSS